MKMIPPLYLIQLDPVFDAVPSEMFYRVNEVFGIHQDPLYTVREDIRQETLWNTKF